MELLIKIVYLSDATIPSEMANSVSIINLCNAFNELGAEIHLVKPWRYKNRKINPDDIYKIYGINNKFNIVNTPYLDLSMIQNFSPDLLLRSVNYLSKRIWQKHVVNYVVNNFSPDIIHMRNNIPFALYHLRKMNKLVFKVVEGINYNKTQRLSEKLQINVILRKQGNSYDVKIQHFLKIMLKTKKI